MNFSRYLLTAPLALLLATIAGILWVNQGHFVYIMDDPYIHLAMANRIQSGTYGINIGEFASPSSSPLWPLLLALVPSSLPGWELLPLLINLCCAWGILRIYGRALQLPQGNYAPSAVLLAGLILAIAVDIVGLTVTGMEHALQVWVSLVAVAGIVQLERGGEFPRLALLALIAGPLIRYENMSVTGPACLYLMFMGHWRKAVLVGVAVALPLAAFAWFLTSHGLPPLPVSVLAKATEVGTSTVAVLLANAVTNLRDWHAWQIFPPLLLALYKLLRTRVNAERRLALLCLAVLVLHFVGGRFHHLFSYAVYAIAVAVLLLCELYRTELRAFLAEPLAGVRALTRSAALVVALPLMFPGYVYLAALSIRASHCIYLQQFQMSRFAHDYWRGPVAINDLGLVALKSPNYVLDLWGLASFEALRMRQSGQPQAAWMARLARERQASLAMLYMEWFPDIPRDWRPVAELSFDGMKVAVAGSKVTFFATDESAVPQLRQQLESFAGTLPSAAKFRLL